MGADEQGAGGSVRPSSEETQRLLGQLLGAPLSPLPFLTLVVRASCKLATVARGAIEKWDCILIPPNSLPLCFPIRVNTLVFRFMPKIARFFCLKSSSLLQNCHKILQHTPTKEPAH